MLKGRRAQVFIARILFILLLLIALYVRDDFVRPFGGDVLVVVFLYFVLRAVTGWAKGRAAVTVLGFAILVEISQGLGLVERLGLSGNRIAEIILGSTFDFRDLVAYATGIVIAYLFDRT